MNKFIAPMVPLVTCFHTASAGAHEILSVHSHGDGGILALAVLLVVATLALSAAHRRYSESREK